MKALKQVSFLTVAVLAIGCGQKDPIKNYDSLNEAVPPYKMEKPKEEVREPKNKLFFVELVEGDSLNFVQGKENKARFQVRLAFKDNAGVRFELQMTEGPTSQMGARFSKTAPNEWTLTWKAGHSILTPSDSFKEIPFKLNFALLDSSSPESKEQLKGLVTEETLLQQSITLYKDTSVPVVENVLVSPASSLNVGDTAKFEIIVAAAGLDSPDSLQIWPRRSSTELNDELVQFDGFSGVRTDLKRVKALGLDKDGRSRFSYSMEFDSQLFMDTLMPLLSAHSKWSAQLKAGKISSADAIFNFVVVNTYNNAPANIKRTVKINLTAKAGVPRISGDGVIALEAGAVESDTMYAYSSDYRSEVAVTSLQLGENKVELKKGVAVIDDSAAQVSLTCRTDAGEAKTIVPCKSAKCAVECKVRVQTKCEGANKSIALLVNVKSAMGALTEEKSLPLNVNILKAAKSCVSNPPSAAVNAEVKP